MKPTEQIYHLNPCMNAIEWLHKYDSSEVAWRECKRGDWMAWLLVTQIGPPLSKERVKLTKTVLSCVQLLHIEINDYSKKLINLVYEDKYPIVNITPYLYVYKFSKTDLYIIDIISILKTIHMNDLKCYASRGMRSGYGTDLEYKDTYLEACANLIYKEYPDPPDIKRM